MGVSRNHKTHWISTACTLILTVSVTTNCRISWNNESANGKHKSDTTLHVKVCPQHFTWMGTEMIDDKKREKKLFSLYREETDVNYKSSEQNKRKWKKEGGRGEKTERVRGDEWRTEWHKKETSGSTSNEEGTNTMTGDKHEWNKVLRYSTRRRLCCSLC